MPFFHGFLSGYEGILCLFGTMKEVGKKAVDEGMFIFRWHFKCHRLILEGEDEGVFLWRVDNRTAGPDIDRVCLIEDVIQKEAVFFHLRLVGKTEGGAKEIFFVMEVEAGGMLLIVAGKTGAHF